jgi:hypothetical protein
MADAMELSKQVYKICARIEDPSEELKAFLETNPHVSVTQHKDAHGKQALHRAPQFGHAACVRMLLQHGADVHARDVYGRTALVDTLHGLGMYHYRASTTTVQKECMQLLIEANADVNGRDNHGRTATHIAVEWGNLEYLQLLISNGADVNTRDGSGGTPAITACIKGSLSCVQLLVDSKADLNVLDNDDGDALHYVVFADNKTKAFPVLCCNTNAADVKTSTWEDYEYYDQDDMYDVHDDHVGDDKRDACIEEYEHTLTYIDGYHEALKGTLSAKVEVDTRFGLGENGIYHEPLERVLEYMGLSMDKDQVVNASIDGDTKRALIPFQLQNAKLWFERASIDLYKQRRHTSLLGDIERYKMGILKAQAEIDSLYNDSLYN